MCCNRWSTVTDAGEKGDRAEGIGAVSLGYGLDVDSLVVGLFDDTRH